jgi:hypothetical protein
MRHCPSANDSSEESEYAESVADGVGLDTDLTDVDTCTDEDAEDEAWLSPDEDHPPEHYLQQLEIFDEQKYMEEDYTPGSVSLLNRMEDQWNQ